MTRLDQDLANVIVTIANEAYPGYRLFGDIDLDPDKQGYHSSILR